MKYALIILVFLLTSLTNAQCGGGGDYIYLNSQADIDNFANNYPGCTTIDGSLYISGIIYNLNGLSQLTSVNYNLNVSSENLTSLQGLHNITHVYGWYYIEDSPSLTNFDALSTLTHLENLQINNCGIIDLQFLANLSETSSLWLNIYNNNSLVSLNGLENFETIRRLQIIGNDNLASVNALQNLMSIHTLIIRSNPSLLSLSGFENLETTQDISITDNAQLQSISGFNALPYGIIEIENNNNLQDIIGFNNLVEGSFRVDNNNSLHILNGFSGAANDIYLSIGNNDNLESLDIFSNASAIAIGIGGNEILSSIKIASNATGPVEFFCLNNPSLTNIFRYENVSIVPSFVFINNDAYETLDFFPNVSQILYEVEISNNQALNEIASFSSTELIGTHMYIYNNPSLETINDLNDFPSLNSLNIEENDLLQKIPDMLSLTTIRDGITISNNNTISNLHGLNSLTSIGGPLKIIGNNNLNDISGLSSLTNLGDQDLQIEYNEQLVTLEGIENIDPNTILRIIIQGNPNLEVCNFESICNFLEEHPSSFFHEINNNAIGCESAEAVADECGIILGFPTPEISTFNLYPNPVKNILNIVSNTGLKSAQIFNTMGQNVFSEENLNTMEINVSSLNSGVYLLKLTDEQNNSTVKKFIKE